MCTYVHPFQCGQTSLLEELLPGGVYTCVYTPALYVSVGAKGHGEPLLDVPAVGVFVILASRTPTLASCISTFKDRDLDPYCQASTMAVSVFH